MRGIAKTAGPAGGWRGGAAAAALVGLTTAVGTLARGRLLLPDLVALYLLAIALSATAFGRASSLVAASLSVLAYDFFFVPPLYTFAVSDFRHIVTFAVMFVVGSLISGITLRLRRHERDALTREERTAALYALSRDLSAAPSEAEAARAFARRAKETFHAEAAVFLDGEGGALRLASTTLAEPRQAEASRRIAAGARARGFEPPAGALHHVPLRAGPRAFGALAFSPPLPASAHERAFVEAFTQLGALALERIRLTREADAAALRARTEEMRSALLSTISHDLRTPLAVITGAATALRDEKVPATGPEGAELVETICEEADRLERLVRNLLDMTQLQSGALRVKREWVPVEEIVGSALGRLEAALGRRPVRTDLPADLPPLAVDAVLFEQVFVNLLENVAKYTPDGSPVDIEARADGARVFITVGDRGPGLPAGAEARVFEKFFRAAGAGAAGAGLGLAICRGIVEAHGGAIVAENRRGGGADFVITLPLPAQPPAVPAELDPRPEAAGLERAG